MVRNRSASPCRHGGFALLELALSLLVLGIVLSVGLPMLSLQLRSASGATNAASVRAAADALVGHAVSSGGLPGPYRFDGTGSELANSDEVRSALRLSDGAPVRSSAGAPGALPADLLGVRGSGHQSHALLYDVHPGLRSDLPYVFSTAPYGSAGESSTEGTGGSSVQLCRNLNTLIELERLGRAGAAGHVLPLPRAWRDASSFLEPGKNSTVMAAVVVRRNGSGLWQLDRENNVVAKTGLYTKDAAELRIYENPATRVDPGAYDGDVAAISLPALREALLSSGQCRGGAAACRNNQLHVTFQNDVTVRTSTDGAAGPSIGATMLWSIDGTVFEPIGAGQSASYCVDAFALQATESAKTLSIRFASATAAQAASDADKARVLAGAAGWVTRETLDGGGRQEIVLRCGGIGSYESTTPDVLVTTGVSCSALN
ncbi:hypothetical protein GCM10023089_08820 [Quisquiliibacterium transsilvanicum]